MTEDEVALAMMQRIEATRGRRIEAWTPLIEAQIFDSMGFIEWVAWVETCWGVSFEADEIEKAFASIATTAAAVIAKKRHP